MLLQMSVRELHNTMESSKEEGGLKEVRYKKIKSSLVIQSTIIST